MARYAPHVYSDQPRIAALEALIAQLPDEARVQLTLDDGTRVLGTVSVRPALQLFFDHDNRQGMNAMVRIDDLDQPVQQHRIWLDRISEVRSLPPLEQ
ncbi:DUF3247 family protein [Flavobacterium sp. MXW15]|uniref:DUF3247 family protein n=1 Tax=Xanthomonas chitinilytica TaxID=2989819 RepID=A0ABT3JT82_9XANT|nr:DUF3247 family protein [Xanthomonas sp. H13-6]MCW4454451.1 DUF3247 family protein [Flavobacterium sp. MXW15]MCW4471691.1 DUF3247 family protein [Xanthomonas sp. H13-6]